MGAGLSSWMSKRAQMVPKTMIARRARTLPSGKPSGCRGIGDGTVAGAWVSGGLEGMVIVRVSRYESRPSDAKCGRPLGGKRRTILGGCQGIGLESGAKVGRPRHNECADQAADAKPAVRG